ncbi:MAG: ABC-2 transporter permease [Lachnospiraceae bacterium]|nr:ABC-2 transporter permease [Lachnospiraceae bacterium]
MMKGLLFKEFYLTRKTYLGFLLVFVGVASLCVLVCLSMICGNLQSIPAESPEEVESFFQMFVYVPYGILVFAVTVCEHSIFTDYASGWMKYSYTLPTPAKKAIGARYLTGIIIAVGSIALGLCNAGIMSLILDKPITAEIVKNMLVILLIAIGYIFFDIPMALKYKTAQAVGNRVGSVMILAYIAVGAYMMNKIGQMSTEMSDQYLADMMTKAANIRDMILPFSPIIMLVLFGISFMISIKLYQRREK